jgi:hypothetical protein
MNSTVRICLAATFVLSFATSCLGFQIESLKTTSLVFPSTKPIEGRIVDESGLPIIGAVIGQFLNSDDIPANASMPPYDISKFARTDIRGKFKLTEIEHRFPCYFSVYHPDYLVRLLRPIETLGDVVMTKPKLISGRLIHHDGTPASGYSISFETAPDRETIGFDYGKFETDDEGKFTLPTLYGYSQFFVSKPGQFRIPYQWREKKPESPNELSDEILVYGEEIEARLPKPRSIEITLVSAATGRGVPLASAQALRCHPSHLSGHGRTSRDRQGLLWLKQPRLFNLHFRWPFRVKHRKQHGLV